MPANPIDFEKYAQTLQETMAKAIAEAESLAARAAADRDAIAGVRVARQEKLNDLEHQGRQTATNYVTENSRQIKETIRTEIRTLIATKLLNSGQDVPAIAALLEVPEDFVNQAGKR